MPTEPNFEPGRVSAMRTIVAIVRFIRQGCTAVAKVARAARLQSSPPSCHLRTIGSPRATFECRLVPSRAQTANRLTIRRHAQRARRGCWPCRRPPGAERIRCRSLPVGQEGAGALPKTCHLLPPTAIWRRKIVKLVAIDPISCTSRECRTANVGTIGVRAEKPDVCRKRAFMNHA
jgi:hypothetical protein